MGLRDWLRRKPEPVARRVRLRSAEDSKRRYQEDGANRAAAIAGTRRQVAGLRYEIADDARWARLVTMARQIGDPWNADDWPLGFDGLVVAVPLCTDVSFECARCPVGQRQDGRSCAHPKSAFGRIGDLVRRDDRDGLRAQLDSIEALLDAAERE